MVTKRLVAISLAMSFAACAPEVRLASNSSASEAQATLQLKMQQDKTTQVKETLSRVRDSLAPYLSPLKDILGAIDASSQAQTNEAVNRIGLVLERLKNKLETPLKGGLIRYSDAGMRDWSAESRFAITRGEEKTFVCNGAIRIEGRELTSDSELILLSYRDCSQITTNLAVLYVTKDSIQTYFDLSGMKKSATSLAEEITRFTRFNQVKFESCRLSIKNDQADMSCDPFEMALRLGSASFKKLALSASSTDFKAQIQVELLDANGKHVADADVDTARNPKIQYNNGTN